MQQLLAARDPHDDRGCVGSNNPLSRGGPRLRIVPYGRAVSFDGERQPKKLEMRVAMPLEKCNRESAEWRVDETDQEHRPFNGVRDEMGWRGIHRVPRRRRIRGECDLVPRRVVVVNTKKYFLLALSSRNGGGSAN